MQRPEPPAATARAFRFIRDAVFSYGSDDRYDTDQPWICWRFLSTDARTRITGRSVVRLDCCVCGAIQKSHIRIPRRGPVADRGKHPERLRFMLEHLHPDKGHPMSWAKPLRNPAAHSGGIDLGLLAMRLENELYEAESSRERWPE